MREAGLPAPMVAMQLEVMAAIRAEKAATVTDTVEKVTGHPARTYAAWGRDNVDAFR